jgi:hypothetical protein
MSSPTPSTNLDPGSLAQWVAAGATFLAVLVALFKTEITHWWRRPKLSARIKLSPPDCSKTQLDYVAQKTALTVGRADCYYLRIWIENLGKTRAEQVQVYASKLWKRAADGSFSLVDNFLPMNLKWAHGPPPPKGPEIFAEGISPRMGKHCDLAHVVDPKHRANVGHDLEGVPTDQTILALNLEVAPNTLTHLIAPGKYRLKLRIAGGNCSPITKTLELALTGKWYADQARMFTDGLGIKVID